jgi:hypothetical protein
MELSHSLSRVTRHLLRAGAGAVETFVHSPQEATRDRCVVVCEWERNPGKRLKSSGTAKNKLEAYMKAVVELGEAALCDGISVPNRTGVAGGLIVGNAVERAKAELMERDAFLFHYRNQVPFVKREPVGAGAWLFELSSPQDGVHCFIALDRACVEGIAECILMGLGCHGDRGAAVEKALGELACMVLDHSMRPGWCRAVYSGASSPARLTDMHHAASRDPRNMERFRALCATGPSEALRGRGNLAGNWRVECLTSPLRYFKYVRVSHADLAVLEFGKPEPSASPEEAPLFHPVW